MTARPDAFKDIVPLLAPSCSTLPCSRHTIYDVCAGGEFLSPLRECAADTVEPPQEEELARLYHIPIPSQTDLPISYNIAPSQKVLTIRFNPETRARSLDALQWGLIPYWAKDPNIAYRTINARAETIDKAPSFRRLSLNGAA